MATCDGHSGVIVPFPYKDNAMICYEDKSHLETDVRLFVRLGRDLEEIMVVVDLNTLITFKSVHESRSVI